ncbi:cytosolic carboxypeptidase 6 isoform X1 [Onychomys torridus]|uniref:cytosolic carboxypeptidase 6 isoform X1 n=1 Tax=Onychomys torridus TaxID=38674 RepID=UPI00167F9945|nr:cytosolic carboxypeptidase 6 isoform X1 [Onychomys torridus]
MYAFVRFLEDNVCYALPVSCVRDFSPRSRLDFDNQKVYAVYRGPEELGAEPESPPRAPRDWGTLLLHKAQILALAEDKSDLENSVMQKKIKIPKLSLSHLEDDGEVKDYGEEDLQLRHIKRPEGRKPSEAAHKSIEAVVARLEKQNGLSLGHSTCSEEVFVEASPGTEDMDSLEDAVVPRALYEELLRNYQQQQEEMRHLQQELERTRRQLVQQAKKLKEYGALVSEMKELRDLNRRLQDVLLLRLGSENLREGTEKKVIFITGRVHPGETPSSFVCQGIIDFLVSQHPIARVLREHLVFKIAPMLNPDGVYLGNYRCSLMGFDLNRHWLDPSPWAHPTLHGVKQLIIKMYNDPKTSLEFYIDIHAHSTMMNGFMYGNIFEDEERFQRQSIFPKLLCQNAEDFSYTSTSFNRDAVKAGTGRRFLGGLLDHTSYCYTLEVSFYSYIIGGTTAAVPYTEEAYMKLGRNVARTFLDYYRLNSLVERMTVPMPRLRKETPTPHKHPSLRGSASNVPNSKGDKKSSLNHKDSSTPF